jgi:hypothetical protein
MASPVTDPALLAQLNAPEPKRVTDPALLAALNAPAAPIDVKAPDGSIVRFPAGTSDDTINGAMRKEFGGPTAAEPKSALERIRDAIHAPTRALENGLFMGLADRARAVMDAGTEALAGKGFNYGADLKQEQGETEQFAKDHPIAAPVLEGVGGALVPLGAAGAASKAATIGGKMLAGGTAGATLGGIQGAAGSKDYTDLPQVAKDAGFGGAAGLLVVGAMPAAGAAIGAAYRGMMNVARGRVDGMSRAAGGHLVSAMEADGPAAVQARMAELGPDATPADAGPAFLGKAQGASLNSDEGRSVLQGTLTTRDKGTNARIQSDVNDAIGPAQDQGALTASDRIRRLREEQDAVSYPAALNAAPPVKIAPIMTDLVDRINQTPVGGMENKALTNLQTMLTKTTKQPMLDSGGYPVYDKFGNDRWKNVAESHDDANVLHKAKVEIDNVVEHDKPGLGIQSGALNNQQASLKQLRFQLNSALEAQVPGYAAANRASAALAKRAEAVKAGTQILGSGKETAEPERFAFDFAGLSHGEKVATAKGLRSEVDRILGTQANDLGALRTGLQGEGGWNQAKIGTVYGEPAAQKLADTVDRNAAFRKTYSDVVLNSQTAQRQAAARAMKPEPSSETPFFNPNSTMTGMLATGVKKTANAALNAVRPDPTRSYGEVARALTEQGAKRDQRIQSIVDALQGARPTLPRRQRWATPGRSLARSLRTGTCEAARTRGSDADTRRHRAG